MADCVHTKGFVARLIFEQIRKLPNYYFFWEVGYGTKLKNCKLKREGVSNIEMHGILQKQICMDNFRRRVIYDVVIEV